MSSEKPASYLEINVREFAQLTLLAVCMQSTPAAEAQNRPAIDLHEIGCRVVPGESKRYEFPKQRGPADIEGRIAYITDDDRVTVEIDRIRNNTTSTTTGPLYVTMLLTLDSDPESEGVQVARHRINGTLGPGQSFSNIRQTLTYQAPSPGAYCVHFYTSQHPDPDVALDRHWCRNPDMQVVTHHDNGSTSGTARVRSSAFRDCEACPLMVPVPAGSFSMGAPECEPFSKSNERPRRPVNVPSFAMGVYEVTFAEWDACVAGGGCNGYTPEHQRDWGHRDARPVIRVSWKDAQRYARWLSDSTKYEYRLPTEAEWEYAARASTATPFHTGGTISSMHHANFNGRFPYDLPIDHRVDIHGKTVPVGSFLPNRFGLYDVHGNVSEWVEDCLGDYRSALSKCTHERPTRKTIRVLRGGSWKSNAYDLRSARRFGNPDDYGRYDPTVGFRIVRTDPTPPIPRSRR